MNDINKKSKYTVHETTAPSNEQKGYSMRVEGLFLKEQIEILKKNGSPENSGKNLVPVALLEIGEMRCSFLVTELDATNPDIAFGLIENDSKFSLGKVNLNDLWNTAKQNNAELKQDLFFDGEYSIAVYTGVALKVGTIITDTKAELFAPVFKEMVLNGYNKPTDNLENHQVTFRLKL